MYYYYLPINPEPWAMGEAGVGRKNGSLFARISPNANLVGFQNAVKEELEGATPLPQGEYSLTFYLWRQQADYISSSDRRVRRHVADATNMQKGLEDALQGILFDNDRSVKDIRTVIVEQGPGVIPFILIAAKNTLGFNPDELSDEIWDEIDKQRGTSSTVQPELDWSRGEDIF